MLVAYRKRGSLFWEDEEGARGISEREKCRLVTAESKWNSKALGWTHLERRRSPYGEQNEPKNTLMEYIMPL